MSGVGSLLSSTRSAVSSNVQLATMQVFFPVRAIREGVGVTLNHDNGWP